MYEIILEQPDFDSAEPCPDLWSHPRLMLCAARLQGLEPKILKVYKGQFLAASLPLYERRRMGAVSLLKSNGSYYQELKYWHQKEAAPARRLLDELKVSSAIASYLSQHYRKIFFNLSPSSTDMRGFTWNKLFAQPLYTFEHHLSNELMPLRDEREKLNRAQARGYTFECRLDADALLELCDDMFDRKGPHFFSNPKKMKEYVQGLYEAGLLRQYNVCLDGKPVSSNILLSASDDTAYTVLRASKREEMRHGVSLWHTLKLTQELKNDYRVIDFCGANVPDVARFKAAMGLQLRVFYRISS